MSRYSNDLEEVKRRVKEYDCDGICYSDNKMCNRVYHCPETRSKEFATTVIAVVLLVSIYAAVIVLFILCMVGFN